MTGLIFVSLAEFVSEEEIITGINSQWLLVSKLMRFFSDGFLDDQRILWTMLESKSMKFCFATIWWRSHPSQLLL